MSVTIIVCLVIYQSGLSIAGYITVGPTAITESSHELVMTLNTNLANTTVEVLVDRVFSEGTVVGFELFHAGNGVPLRLQAWRPLSVLSVFQLVGETRIVISKKGVTKVDLSFDQYFSVKSGDLLGFTTEGYAVPVGLTIGGASVKIIEYSKVVYDSFSPGSIVNASQASLTQLNTLFNYGINAKVYNGSREDLRPPGYRPTMHIAGLIRTQTVYFSLQIHGVERGTTSDAFLGGGENERCGNFKVGMLIVGANYEGCFQEPRLPSADGIARPRVFAGGVSASSKMAPPMCQTSCAEWGFKYSGLTQGRLCFCSNVLIDVSYKKPDTDCNQPCADPASTAKCGDMGEHVSVYRSTIPIKDFRLDVAKTLVKKDDVIHFGPLYSSGADLDFSFAYGDGTPPTANNATDMFSKSYSAAGEYKATLTATSASDPTITATASALISVQEEVSRVELLCPPSVVTYEEFSCNASLELGTDPSFTIDWGDATTETFPITGPLIHSAGAAVYQAGGTDVATDGTLIVLPSAEFLHDGTLLKFELFATKIGSLELLILEPKCTSPAYCFGSNQCQASCAKAGAVLFSDADKTKWRTSACRVNTPVTGCSETTARYKATANSPHKANGYTITWKMKVFVITTGYQKFDAPADVLVSKGSIIGVYQENARVGTRALIAGEEFAYYTHSGTTTTVGTDIANTAITEKPNTGLLVSALATKPSRVLVHHIFKTPNVYPVKATVNNLLISAPAVQSTATVDAQEGVDFAIIQTDQASAKTNVAFKLTAATHTGASVQYTWNFGAADVVTSVPEVTHTFTSRGKYNVTLMIANAISSKFNFTEIIVQDELKTLLLTAPHSKVGEATTFAYSLAAGSDYTCTFDMADGNMPTITQETTLSGNLVHTYSADGERTIKLTCENNVSSLSVEKTIQAQHPITSIDLNPKGATFGNPFQVTFCWATGTSPSCTLTFDGSSKTVTVDASKKCASSNTINAIASYGAIPVAIQCTNLVSTDNFNGVFTIESEIQGPTFTALPKKTDITTESDIKVAESVAFTVDMTAGTGVSISINYGDGNTDTHSINTGVGWSTAYKTTHIFSTAGVYVVTATIGNNINSVTMKHTVNVYNSVQASMLSLSTDSPQQLLQVTATTAKATLTFQMVLPPGKQLPTKAEIRFEFGDGKVLENVPFTSAAAQWKHDYFQSKTFNVKVTISNAISTQDFTTVVEAVKPIEGMSIVCLPYPQPAVNVPVEIMISFSYGPKNMTIDFGDGSAKETIIRPALTSQSTGQTHNRLQHTYATYQTSPLVIRVDAWNILGTTSKTYTVITQHPVTDDYAVTTPNQDLVYTGGPIEVPIVVTYPNIKQLPTDASIAISWGDGKQDGPTTFSALSFASSRSATFKHNFAATGLYEVVVTIFNRASSQNYTLQIGVYEPLNILKVTPKYERDIGKADVVGGGAAQNEFPLNKAVRLYVDFQGTAIRMDVTATSATAVESCRKETSPVELNFKEPGTYSVTVTGVNGLGDKSKTVTVIIVDNVETSCSLPAITGPGETNVIKCKFARFTADTCLCTDTLYNGNAYAGDELCYGPTSCQPDNARKHVNKGPISANININRVLEAGSYQIVLKAKNSVSDQAIKLSFPVSSATCNQPRLAIQNGHQDFRKPLPIYKKNSEIFIGKTVLDCKITYTNKKEWAVEQVDSLTGEIVKVIDISAIPSRSAAEFSLPGNFLPYGVYKLTYKVTMDTEGKIPAGEEFKSEDFTFINVIESQLSMSGKSIIVVKYGDTVLLDPKFFDPDSVPHGSQGISVGNVYCRSIEENYDFTSTKTITPYSASVAQQVIGKGCFKQGTGLVSVTSFPFEFSSYNMEANAEIEFLIYIKKGSRTSKFKIMLILQQTNYAIPDINIKFTPGVSAERTQAGWRVRSDVRLGLDVEAPAGYSLAGAVVTWSLDMYGIHNARVAVNNFEDYVKGVHDTNSRSISVDAKLFQDYEMISKYRLLCKVRFANGAEGMSYIVVDINRKPVPGTSTITPLVGTVGDTLFTIDSTLWSDSDSIMMYLYYVVHAGEDMPVQLYQGSDPRVQLALPVGRERNNYEMDVYASVMDIGRVKTTLKINTVKVMPLSKAALDSKVSTLAADVLAGTGDFVRTLRSENMKETATLSLVVASDLNDQRRQQHAGEKCRDSVVSLSSTCYEPYCEQATTLIDCSETEKEALNRARNNRAVVRGAMINGITLAASAESTDTALVALSALSEVTRATEEVPRSSQIEIVDFIARAADVLTKEISTTPLEEIQNLLAAVISLDSNVKQAMYSSAESGLNSEIAEAIESPLYQYPTNIGNNRYRAHDGSSIKEWEKDANSEVQKLANIAMKEILSKSTEKIVLAAVSALNPAEPTMNINTANAKLTLTKDKASLVLDKVVTIGRADVQFPSYCNMVKQSPCSADDIVTLQVTAATGPSYRSQPNGIHLSSNIPAVDINVFREDNTKISITDSEPIKIKLNSDPNAELPVTPEVTKHEWPDQPWAHMLYHSVQIERPYEALQVSFKPNDTNTRLLVLVRANGFPNLTTHEYDQVYTIPSDVNLAKQHNDSTKTNPYYTFTIPSKQMKAGKLTIGIREYEPNEPTYSSDNPPPTPKQGTGHINSDYTMTVISLGCYFYDEKLNMWSNENVMVVEESRFESIVCSTTHLTTFAGGWVVMPNPIDWNFVFANLDFAKNPTLYITMIVIAVIYILCAIWARRQDNKDKEKLGVCPLPDNDPEDKYLYEVIMFTGMRRNAGTDSKVHFIISGEYDETDVRIIEDSKRKILRRGSQDSFLMAVPRPLGALNYIRVWHDNSGKGKFASWYLKYILVQDLQTREKFYFISNRWFAVEEDDGQVDRLLPVAGPEQMMEFGHLFAQRTAKNMGDGHLWFSVVARPPQSRFTRLQRVSCCMCLLFTSMLANAMFYKEGQEKQNTFTLGPFAVSPEQIFIGIASNIIVFPVNFLVMTLFRRSRPRKKRPSRIREAIKQNTNKAKAKAYRPTSDVEANRPISVISRPLSSMSRPQTATPQKYKKPKRPFSFPWWVVVVSWLILWLTVLACAAIVLAYGITFQDIKCKKWISSMLVSFFTSVFLTQPIKVILVATFFSLIVRRASEEEEDLDEDEEDLDLDLDEVYLHFPQGQQPYGVTKPRKIAYMPPDPESLERARDLRLKEIKMFDILREITFYAFFLWILLVISYSLRDPNAYQLHRGMKDIFIQSGLRDSLDDVRSVKQYWRWAKHVLVPGLRATQWYNGDQPFGQRGFIHDRCGRMMGYATLRQLRIRKGACQVTEVMEKVIHECNPAYSILDEESRDYGIGWQPLNVTPTGNNSRYEYIYREGSEIDSYPYWGVHGLYSGGGYVVELRGTRSEMRKKLEMLENEAWIDKYTRGLFVEFTVYNPNVNLFAAATILSENVDSGGFFSSWRFEPMNLLAYFTSAMLFQIICEVTFLLFVVFFIVRDIRRLVSQRRHFFKEFWNWVDISSTILCIASVVIYFYRLLISNALVSTFSKSQGNDYIKFQYCVGWNVLLTYIVAWIVFLSTIKFLRLLRFNKRMSMMSSTLRYASENLLMFGLVFAIIFFAFVQFFYLIYSIQIQNFSTFVNSAETCLQMFLGRFNFYAMQANAPFLGPFFFFIYVVTVAYILINMFLSILNESFSAVRQDISKQNNDYEMVDFVIRRFKVWTGIGDPQSLAAGGGKLMDTDVSGASAVKPAFERTIDKFPEKVEHLLNSISKVYFDTERFDDIFDNNTLSKDSLRGMILKERYKRATAHGMGQHKMADVEELENELRMV